MRTEVHLRLMQPANIRSFFNKKRLLFRARELRDQGFSYFLHYVEV